MLGTIARTSTADAIVDTLADSGGTVSRATVRGLASKIGARVDHLSRSGIHTCPRTASVLILANWPARLDPVGTLRAWMIASIIVARWITRSRAKSFDPFQGGSVLTNAAAAIVVAVVFYAIGAAWCRTIRRRQPTYFEAFTVGGLIVFLAIIALAVCGGLYYALLR